MNKLLQKQREMSKDAQGFSENRQAAKMDGKIAGDARKQLELGSGKKVGSQDNFNAQKIAVSEKKMERINPRVDIAFV